MSPSKQQKNIKNPSPDVVTNVKFITPPPLSMPYTTPIPITNSSHSFQPMSADVLKQAEQEDLLI